MEYWNNGMMGSGKMDDALLVKFLLTGEFINEKFPLKNNPAKDGIFDFPIFHPSIIPHVRQTIEP